MVCLLCLTGTLAAQITYTRSFTKKLARAQLEYYEPVEEWLHVVPMRSDDFMQYDLVLEDDRSEYEVRYRIRPFNHRWRQIPLHVEAGRLVASIASNLGDSEIRMEFPGDAFFMTHFKADAGLFAHFSPKGSFSDKPYGTLISLVSMGHAIVDVVLLYRDQAYDPVRQFRNLSFIREVQ